MDMTFRAVKYLNGIEGIGATAYPQVPSTRPDTFVVIERTGGADANRVQAVESIDADCWAESLYAASELAARVRAALLEMPDAYADVFHAEITTTYLNTDMDSGTPRYTVSADITINR